MRSICVLLLVAVVGCSSSGKGPALASSSGHTSYAIRYADELASSSKAVADAQAREKAAAAGFSAHVDELKKPDWDRVQTIIDDSDQAGRSAGFAEAHVDSDAVKAFWDSEKDTITGRVSGGASHAAKEGGCSADVAGPIAYSLNDSFTKQLQKRLRGRNEAFVTIERYKTSFGPQNVAALEKLADEISQASYDVHVAMVLQRERLQRMVADKDGVKKSLDRYVADEAAFQAEPGRTEPEKKASADRVTAANKSKAEVDSAAAQAETTAKQMDTAIAASTKDYDEALKAVRAKVLEKKKSEPPAKGK